MTRDAIRQTGVALAVGSGVVLGVTGDYGSGAASPSLVQPPSWAFGIWGPIYVGLLAYAVQQALPPGARARPSGARAGGPPRPS